VPVGVPKKEEKLGGGKQSGLITEDWERTGKTWKRKKNRPSKTKGKKGKRREI